MDSIEILKASVPFATITGVIVGALLNSRLSRRDKIRDHLFSYKVKSYSTLAEKVVEIKRDLEEIRNSLYASKIKDKEIKYIWAEFRKASAEQTLFIADQTKADLKKLNDSIFKIVELEISVNLGHIKNGDVDFISYYSTAIFECSRFIKKIQSELGINKLNKERKKWI